MDERRFPGIFNAAEAWFFEKGCARNPRNVLRGLADIIEDKTEP
jgi:hypothetical protein